MNTNEWFWIYAILIGCAIGVWYNLACWWDVRKQTLTEAAQENFVGAIMSFGFAAVCAIVVLVALASM